MKKPALKSVFKKRKDRSKTSSNFRAFWSNLNLFKKVLALGCVLVIALLLLARLIAFQYQQSHKNDQFKFGTTFSADYARSLGLDSHETLDAILSDMGIKQLRLVSYWSDGEKDQGKYDFSELDWEMQQAEKHGAKVSLAIGLRQPRWPECHAPDWAKNLNRERWQPSLEKYIALVVDRYKNSPALESYQLENEFFLKAFGQCTDFSRDRLVTEFNLVKSIDSKHPVIVSRSNNWAGWEVGQPTADQSAISIYRKVYNQTIGYVRIPYPAWYYAFLASIQQKINGRSTIIHEFQLEPWIKSGPMQDSSIGEQNKTMSQQDVKNNIDYAKKTGIKEVYFWGSEWWYWRLKQGDPTIWNTVKQSM